jgi:acetyl-CoA C-acetyltransferase
LKRVGIIGMGYEGFRPVLPDISTREMMFLAASRAYLDASIDPRNDVDTFICCTEDFWEGWSITDEMVPDQIGAARRALCTVTSDSINGIANAFMQIQSGLSDVVVVEAHSKSGDVLTKKNVEELALEPVFLRTQDVDTDIISGLEMDYFMERSGVKRSDLDELIITEKKRAISNPRASYGAILTKEDIQVSGSTVVPVSKYDRAEYAEGCIVAVLASEDWIRKRKKEYVSIKGIGWYSTLPWYDGGPVEKAEYIEKAFKMALRLSKSNLKPGNFDYIEVDDTYSYKAFQHLFGLGFTKKEIITTLKEGRINIGGGSMGCGNLLEANGLYRVLESYLRIKEKGGTALAASWRGQPTASGAVIILSEGHNGE